MKKISHLICMLGILGSQFQAIAQYSNLHTFDGSAGTMPYGTLISQGAFLYGTTSFGGANNKGTMFRIMPDGTGFTTLFEFDGAISGSHPYGSLVSDGTFFYGMTNEGGAGNMGTVFKINPDGTGYVNLHNFTGNPDGSYPFGSLYLEDTILYGMTKSGGTGGLGMIFKMTTSGAGYATLLSFSGLSNGNDPYGTLISDGTFLYGVTSYGGPSDKGTLFKILPDGTGYTQLFAFTQSLNGTRPFGSLYYDGIFLYGTTNDGGTDGYGGIFKIKTDGTGFIKLMDFNWSNGAGSYTGNRFISDGTFLYGMTSEGGPNGYGKLFRILPDGTGYTSLLDFMGNSNGSFPYGSLYSDGTFLYGMSASGGSYNSGTIFKYNISCSPVTYSWSPVICQGNTVTVGTNTYAASGTYAYVFPLASNGCDSTVITSLTVIPVNIAVTVNVNTLTAIASGAIYQWIDCNNGNAPIPGETNQSFTATSSGNYAVIVTENGCTDTSLCINVLLTGLNDEETENQPVVFTDPGNGQVTIISKDDMNWNITLTNVAGQVILTKSISHAAITEIGVRGPAGVYLLVLENDKGDRMVSKIIKQ